MESLNPNGREPYLSMKRQVQIIVLMSLMENEEKENPTSQSSPFCLLLS